MPEPMATARPPSTARKNLACGPRMASSTAHGWVCHPTLVRSSRIRGRSSGVARRISIGRRSVAWPGAGGLHRHSLDSGVVDDLARRYLLLGLRLGRVVDEFVDSYVGPPQIAEAGG